MNSFSLFVNPVIPLCYSTIFKSDAACHFFHCTALLKELLSKRIVASVSLKIRCHATAVCNTSSQVTLDISEQSLKSGFWRKGTIIPIILVLFSLSKCWIKSLYGWLSRQVSKIHIFCHMQHLNSASLVPLEHCFGHSLTEQVTVPPAFNGNEEAHFWICHTYTNSRRSHLCQHGMTTVIKITKSKHAPLAISFLFLDSVSKPSPHCMCLFPHLPTEQSPAFLFLH